MSRIEDGPPVISDVEKPIRIPRHAGREIDLSALHPDKLNLLDPESKARVKTIIELIQEFNMNPKIF